MNCDICEMWNNIRTAKYQGTWAHGVPLAVCASCYKAGALSASKVPVERVKSMRIDARGPMVDYTNEYDDYVITWYRKIKDTMYVFMYIERAEGDIWIRASTAESGTVHCIKLA